MKKFGIVVKDLIAEEIRMGFLGLHHLSKVPNSKLAYNIYKIARGNYILQMLNYNDKSYVTFKFSDIGIIY